MRKLNQKDQHGIAHLLVIVVIVVIVAVAGFAAWRVSSNKKTTTSSPTATVANKAVEDSCNKELKDKDLCKFASNFKLSGISYRSTVTTVAEGKTTVMNMEVDAKDNSSIVTTEDSKETGAFISFNKATYVKDAASGTWIKYSSSDSSTPKETSPTSDIKIDAQDLTANSTTSYKNLGKEACGKLSCFKYQVTDTQQPGTTSYIWFDTKDYMMQRWSTKDAKGSTDMTFSYVSVTIKEPSPVKEFDAQSNADIQAAQEAAAAAASGQ